MSNMEASTVASILAKQAFQDLVCHTAISRTSRQFESRLFAEMCKLLQITKATTTAYYLKCRRMLERFNKTLVTMLSAYVNENHTAWDEKL